MRIKPILLFGGVSSECRVSVASAQNIFQSVPDFDLWFISRRGAVHAISPEALVRHQNPFERDFLPMMAPSWSCVDEALDSAPSGAVFFLSLHGGDGENGTLQRAFEKKKIAFTGSGAIASELAFDKARAKAVVAEKGVTVAAACIIEGSEDNILSRLTALWRTRGRLVVKPLADGSSVGLHHLRNESDLEPIANAVALSGVPYLAEDFLAGTELTVGVINDGRRTISLPPSEIRLEEGAAFDYAGKYLGKRALEITPAEVPAEVYAEAQQIALLAHKSIGCEGYSRTDLVAGATGVAFIEINTLPGLTATSFIPQQLTASGLDIGTFVKVQINLAIERQKQIGA
ncbi:ATP-grasp domain-containing protein [Methylomonas sp. UP202]|uniref:D-alanine--D-alanine ligase family protein n=1 Tax=Methylomonas sp. UP202 TaxID=3040943 RepID=UPI002479D393|nr:ATP-grasp domain-containing protein [Methylomonas sp. UP202]WGS83972.1 ATP-grasp domain-containing protein [Methylomonas sp. UP202]